MACIVKFARHLLTATRPGRSTRQPGRVAAVTTGVRNEVLRTGLYL